MDLQDLLTEKAAQARTEQESVQPVFFRVYEDTDREKMQQLLQTTPSIKVHDEIVSQLRELIRSLFPAKNFSEEELAEAQRQHLKGRPLEEYGVWVYYPWSGRLVHILDKEEFIDLRTNRNQLKITREERDLLAARKTGIIGLSVGQSVALTMALERTSGELRIADFDTLELSNLNRIRTGVHNLGVSKIVAVAREIAEIDPFLKVVCFPEGLHKDNMQKFFLEGGKLDLVIDECDSLDIKFACRRFARKEKIPVLMDTSDRGMIDIERFDLEPGRPLFHGLVAEDTVPENGTILPAQRLQLSLQIVGGDTISDRMKASLPQIGKTILTWPQLASSVLLGGAVVTELCRKIALNETSVSGRFYVDVSEIIGKG